MGALLRARSIIVSGIQHVCTSPKLCDRTLFFIGLKNAELLLSEKGFFTMAFILSLFAVVTIQKNIRDIAIFPEDNAPLDNQPE